MLPGAWSCRLQGNSSCLLKFAMVTQQEVGRRHPSAQSSSRRPCLAEHRDTGWEGPKIIAQNIFVADAPSVFCRHHTSPPLAGFSLCRMLNAHKGNLSLSYLWEMSDTEGQVPLKMSRQQCSWQVNFCLKIHFLLWSREVMQDPDCSRA